MNADKTETNTDHTRQRKGIATLGQPKDSAEPLVQQQKREKKGNKRKSKGKTQEREQSRQQEENTEQKRNEPD